MINDGPRQQRHVVYGISDFGRTLTSNSDGTDHGWGSHHFVVGGAVQGGDMYGQYPVIGANQANDVGAGRLIPTTSVDQYAGTLARWFGLSDGQIRAGVSRTSPTSGRARTWASWGNKHSVDCSRSKGWPRGHSFAFVPEGKNAPSLRSISL